VLLQLVIRNGLRYPGFDRDQNKPAGVELLRDAAVDICFCVISRVEKNSRSALSGDRYGGTLGRNP
jgi:hypothetical protein